MAEVLECHLCGLPMLTLPHGRACAECDQGVSKGRIICAPWFLAWRQKNRSSTDKE